MSMKLTSVNLSEHLTEKYKLLVPLAIQSSVFKPLLGKNVQTLNKKAENQLIKSLELALQESPKIYQPQLDTASEVYNHFLSGKRHVCVMGDLQAGKTGFIYSLALKTILKQIKKDNPLNVESIEIITGLSSRSLKDQTSDAIKNLANLHTDLPVNVHHNYSTRKNFLKDLTRQKNKLFIIDESQIAQKEGQTLHKVFQNQKYYKDGRYFVSVSATPYAEIYVKNEIPLVTLKTGKGYSGVDYFLKNKHILPTSALNMIEDHKVTKSFQELLIKKQEQTPNGVAIIRCRNPRDFQTMMLFLSRLEKKDKRFAFFEDTAEATSLRVRQNDQDRKSDGTIDFERIENLKQLMTHKKDLGMDQKYTVALVYSKYVAGDNIDNKDLINLVIDNKPSPNVDTVVQGLLGRTCGYYEVNPDLHIYTSIQAAATYLRERDLSLGTKRFEDLFPNNKYVYVNPVTRKKEVVEVKKDYMKLSSGIRGMTSHEKVQENDRLTIINLTDSEALKVSQESRKRKDNQVVLLNVLNKKGKLDLTDLTQVYRRDMHKNINKGKGEINPIIDRAVQAGKPSRMGSDIRFPYVVYVDFRGKKPMLYVTHPKVKESKSNKREITVIKSAFDSKAGLAA